jgi:hypothetical protein
MQLEFSLTPEDLHEASRALNPATNHRRVAWDVAGMFLWFLMSLYYSLPRIFWFNRDFGKRSDAEQNLWLTISPSLCMASFLLISVLITPKVVRLRQTQGANRKAAKEREAVLQLLQFLAALWIIPVVWPPLALHWKPADGQIIWAALAPWFLYLTIIRPIYARRRIKAVDNEWKRNKSLQRQNVVSIDANGVFADDGVVEHRIRWAGFKRYNETDNLLLLQMESGLQIFIPKRAIRDGQEMDAIKMLIHDNIGEGSFKPQASAFPVV